MRFFFKKVILFSLFTLIFSYFNQDSRMISLAGSYNTIAEGYRCIGINPANLIYNEGLMINLLNGNINTNNNFITIDRLNNINGADLENSYSNNYFPKDKVLKYLKGENIECSIISSFPIPMFNISKDNMAFTSRMNFFSNYNISPDIIRLVLYGNEIDKQYDLSMFQNTMVVSELAYSKAYDFKILSFGFSAKYHHGLAYYFLEPTQDSSFFETAITDISAQAEYLIRQNIKGNGYSLDLGVSTNFSDWKLGLSLINLGGKILWNRKMVIDQHLNDLYNSYPLRNNEHYYINLSIENLNINTLNNPNLSINDILVFSGNNVIESYIHPGDDFLLGEDYFISSNNTDTSYYILSDSIPNSSLNELEMKIISTDLPTKLNIGLSKKIDNSRLFVFDLSTGLDNALGNNEKWRASFGYEFGRKEFPLRFGVSYGGYDHQSVAIGIGFYGKKILFDFGIAYKNSLKIKSSSGIDIGFDLFLLKI